LTKTAGDHENAAEAASCSMSRGLGHFTLGAVAACACLAVAPSARADPKPVELAWVRGAGAEACASQHEMALRVGARFAESPFARDATRTIEAYVTRSESGWRARIFVRDPDDKRAGSRELTSDADDCAAIESASVLAIALAIDPEGSMRPPPPHPAIEVRPETPPAPSVVVPAKPVSREEAEPTRPTMLVEPRANLGTSGVALRAGPAFGLLPRSAPAGMLAAEVRVYPRVQITGEALWMPGSQTADGRFGFGLAAFGLGACYGFLERPRVDLAACASLWAGALHAVVYTLIPTEPGDRAWAAAELGPRLRVALGPYVQLEAGSHVFVPLVRQPFTVTGERVPVFQEAPVAFLPYAAAGARFP
jgi:hypothetical protein